ncbi:MAG: hypothetical protein L0216_03300 [Planctomycetales bacterium]|nr:hypothetical protein [Planctomycetales bacterium]
MRAGILLAGITAAAFIGSCSGGPPPDGEAPAAARVEPSPIVLSAPFG